jgi:hypothetical protein
MEKILAPIANVMNVMNVSWSLTFMQENLYYFYFYLEILKMQVSQVHKPRNKKPVAIGTTKISMFVHGIMNRDLTFLG